jgi:hypothetical protein
LAKFRNVPKCPENKVCLTTKRSRQQSGTSSMDMTIVEMVCPELWGWGRLPPVEYDPVENDRLRNVNPCRNILHSSMRRK